MAANAGGVAQLTLPALAPVAGGDGRSAAAWLTAAPGGTVTLAVEPLLTGITVTAPTRPLATGDHADLTATATQAAGGTVTLADPLAHVWSSGDPRVVRVDPVTGRLTALRPGTATVTVTGGGLTGTATVTVG